MLIYGLLGMEQHIGLREQRSVGVRHTSNSVMKHEARVASSAKTMTWCNLH